MVNDLSKLYSTLKMIETKGENTVYMAYCIRFLEQLIAKAKAKSEETEVANDDT